MSNLRIERGTKQELDNTPMVDGQILIEADNTQSTGYMYLDTIGEDNKIKRVLMGSTQEVRPLNQFTIVYYGNGATSGNTNPQTKLADTTIHLNYCGFIRTNYVFREWNTASDGTGTSYNENEPYSLNADLVLYAIWESTLPINTITYYGNDATTGTSRIQNKPLGESVTIYENWFSKTGYVFKEWNTLADGSGVTYDENDIYITNADLVLYAIWEEEVEPPIVDIPLGSVVVAFENDTFPIWVEDSPYYFKNTNQDEVLYISYNNTDYYYHIKNNTEVYAFIAIYYDSNDNITAQPIVIYHGEDTNVLCYNNTEADQSDYAMYGNDNTWYMSFGNTDPWIFEDISASTINSSFPVFDCREISSSSVSSVWQIGDMFLAELFGDSNNKLDIIILSDTPKTGLSSIQYANNTYYYAERYKQNPTDYEAYNFHLYYDNNYFNLDETSRGELAYLIFDGNVVNNYWFSHDADQYITNIYSYNNVTGADSQVKFRQYAQSDWKSTPRDYDEITLTITSGNAYIVWVENSYDNYIFNGFHVVSSNSFTGTGLVERYYSDGTKWDTQTWNFSPSSLTYANNTYYYDDVYVQSDILDLIDGCSLLPTETSTTSWDNDTRGELAYIIFDGEDDGYTTFASHVANQYLTNIWYQPAVVNYIDVTPDIGYVVSYQDEYTGDSPVQPIPVNLNYVYSVKDDNDEYPLLEIRRTWGHADVYITVYFKECNASKMWFHYYAFSRSPFKLKFTARTSVAKVPCYLATHAADQYITGDDIPQPITVQKNYVYSVSGEDVGDLPYLELMKASGNNDVYMTALSNNTTDKFIYAFSESPFTLTRTNRSSYAGTVTMTLSSQSVTLNGITYYYISDGTQFGYDVLDDSGNPFYNINLWDKYNHDIYPSMIAYDTTILWKMAYIMLNGTLSNDIRTNQNSLSSYSHESEAITSHGITYYMHNGYYDDATTIGFDYWSFDPSNFIHMNGNVIPPICFVNLGYYASSFDETDSEILWRFAHIVLNGTLIPTPVNNNLLVQSQSPQSNEPNGLLNFNSMSLSASPLPKNKKSLSSPLLSSNNNSPITNIEVTVKENDKVQIHQTNSDEWFNLYPLMSKEQIKAVSDGVAPTFTFDTTDISNYQRIEIYTNVPNLQVDTITHNQAQSITVTFPPYDTLTYGKSIEALTCKIYFHSVKSS